MVRLTLRLILLCTGFTLLSTSILLGLARLQKPVTSFIVTYQCHHTVYHYQDYTLNRMTANGETLPPFDLPVKEPTDLLWTAAHDWIIFTGMNDGDWDIYRVRPDGTALENLTDSPSEDTMPATSPDYEWIIFASNRRDNFFDLYRMRPDGSHVEPITDMEGHELRPIWSPDGASVAFQYLDARHGWEIYRMEPDGANLQNLTLKPTNDSAPLWSSDGNWMLFSSNRNEDYGLYRMRLPGFETEYLTSGLVDTKNVQWSPDGEWLLFEGLAQIEWDIYRMRGDGSDLQNLTLHDGTDTAPVWSPNGQWIYFSAYRDQRYDIYRMRSDGSQVEKLPAKGCEAADRPSLSPPIDLGFWWWGPTIAGSMIVAINFFLKQILAWIPFTLQ